MGKKIPVEVTDSQTVLLDPIPAKIALHDAHAIRRELGSVYRDMRQGRIEPSTGTRLAYVLDLMRKAHDTSVLQDRIQQLESLVDARGRR